MLSGQITSFDLGLPLLRLPGSRERQHVKHTDVVDIVVLPVASTSPSFSPIERLAFHFRAAPRRASHPPRRWRPFFAMDEDEKRALFRNLRARRRPVLSHSDSSSASASDSDHADSSRTASPARNTQPAQSPLLAGPSGQTKPTDEESVASSDADTIEPESYGPASLPASGSASASGGLSVIAAGRDLPELPEMPSPSSSAETVPPPSPGTMARFQLASDAPVGSPSTAAVPASVRPVVVAIDDGGIDGWEADQCVVTSRRERETQSLAGVYPKLAKGNFKFGNDEEAEVQDLYLSDRKGKEDGRNFGVLPAGVLRYLSSYQRDGVTFMYRLYERNRGGLLADAMGLGKTVQTVCFLGAAFSIWDRNVRDQNADVVERAPRILVVAPTSVRENWKNEFATWTPFRTQLYDRGDEPTIARKLRNGAIDVLIAGDNPVSNYGKGFFSTPCGPKFGSWKWDVVIVDEIHVAKNKTTKIYEALTVIPKKVMFGLTGTAVQNKLKELWNVMSLVVPKRLWPDAKTFRKDFIDIIIKGTKRDASSYMRRKANDRIAVLRQLLAKHIVRRPKSIIESHLPGKTDYCVLMRMKRDGLQGYMYQRFQNSYDVKLLRDAKEPCDCGSVEQSKHCCHRYPSTPENLRNAPIWAMHHKGLGACERCPNCICLYLQHYSRSLAAHALLIMPEDDEPDREKAEFRKKLFKYYLGKHANRALGPLVSLEQEADISCKLNVALRLLKSYEASGHKAIIFYESLRLGSILQRWATNKGLIFEVIDGSVNKGERQGAVDRFNTNSVCSIFFISKKAGGTGLNICGADRVLIFEPCWNPTLDLQAGDRAHRLGQKRVVQIIRLVVENTIEHYVFKTAITKSQVSSAILDNTKEEWRIRENEIGSMHAMLSMGDVFATNESSQDEFRVVEVADLDENKASVPGDRILERNSGLSSPNDMAVRVGDESQDEVDVLGDEVLCSLDVDVEDASWAPSDEEFMDAEERVAPRMEDSQLETDMLLHEGGASGKLVMSSTSARKRKRQVMGVHGTQRTSGINPGGAEGVNFDDASWSDIPLSLESEAVIAKGDDVFGDEKGRRPLGQVPPRQRSLTKSNIPDKRPQKPEPKPKRDNGSTGSAGEKRAKRAPVGKAANLEKPKPKSAFAARARIRR